VKARAAGAAPFVPPDPNLPALQAAVQGCTGCDLYRNAIQAVFGEGRGSASLVCVGEQPGDEEDRQGHPFVGPAGKLLDRALVDAGVDRSTVYVTNAVKHFKFEERGKRRIHQRPSDSEITACRPWLEAEMNLIRPKVILCLGATATRSILGNKYRLTKERGNFVEHPWAPHVTATIHPSAILRMPDSEERHRAYDELVTDLKNVKKVLEKS
jgi:uracil-DNA glycosylase family protein